MCPHTANSTCAKGTEMDYLDMDFANLRSFPFLTRHMCGCVPSFHGTASDSGAWRSNPEFLSCKICSYGYRPIQIEASH